MTKSTATLEVVATSERVIRDLAAHAVNQVRNRTDHPSYGYTKTAIRATREQMEGAIGLYMVLTGQASHASVPSMATFTDPATADLVSRARAAVDSL